GERDLSQLRPRVYRGNRRENRARVGRREEAQRPSRGSRTLKSDRGFVRLRHISTNWRNAMAKGQMRSNKEKKKPKADWNKKKKGGPALSPFALAREPIQPGQNPFAKKG